MKRKRIAKEPAVTNEGSAAAAQAPASSPASKQARAPRASANPVTHRHKPAMSEPQTPAAAEMAEVEVVVPVAAAGAAVAFDPPAELAAPAAPAVEAPLHEEIAIRAYLMAESRGFWGGSPADDWFEAERQLWTERLSS